MTLNASICSYTSYDLLKYCLEWQLQKKCTDHEIRTKKNRLLYLEILATLIICVLVI